MSTAVAMYVQVRGINDTSFVTATLRIAGMGSIALFWQTMVFSCVCMKRTLKFFASFSSCSDGEDKVDESGVTFNLSPRLKFWHGAKEKCLNPDADTNHLGQLLIGDQEYDESEEKITEKLN